jgi:cytochrome c peroxidase
VRDQNNRSQLTHHVTGDATMQPRSLELQQPGTDILENFFNQKKEITMQGRGIWRLSVVVLSLGLILGFTLFAGAQVLTSEEELGKSIFFDKNLSVRDNQSCASCHAPSVGWTGPIPGINKRGAVYFGSVRKRFGNRKPPTVAYGGDSPVLYQEVDGPWVGGMFWDGRASGWLLGDPLAEQAQGPFLNPLEQALPDPSYVVDRVCTSEYSDLFSSVCGSSICGDVPAAYDCIAYSIAAYERSSEVSQFSSKYDAYLRGEVDLTAQEMQGLELFNGKGKCSGCHISDPPSPLFTDYTYDNLGVPRNPENPFYFEPEWNPDGLLWVDTGLGGFLEGAGYGLGVYEPEWGKQKVPTLRNVAKRPGRGFVKAYGHNGYFKSLESIVHFYNTRDVISECPDPFTTAKDALAQDCWPVPEIEENVNTDELGNLDLSPEQEAAIVAFMKTLSDGYTP